MKKAKNPGDELIEHKVYKALSDLSGIDIEKIAGDQEDADQNLKFDLGLTAFHKKALKTYFDNILNESGSTGKVTVRECGDLEQLSDCITLINSKL